MPPEVCELKSGSIHCEPLDNYLLCISPQWKGVGSATQSKKWDSRELYWLWTNIIQCTAVHVILLGLHNKPVRKACLVLFDSWRNWGLEKLRIFLQNHNY